MSLPSNFDPWEHFQSTMMQLHNRRVKREFSDLGEDWTPNISTPRAGLRQACTIEDRDNALICLSKQIFFWFELGFIETLIEPYYGVPVEEHNAYTKFKPSIIFRFKEDKADTLDTGYYPLRSRITVRLVNESSTSITKNELRNIGNRIKLVLCSGNGYKYKRGKELCTYKDPENGLNFQLYVWDKNTAKEVITKILDVFNLSPQWEKFFSHVPENASQAYPTNPGKKQILGEEENADRVRPVGWVRFDEASCYLNGRKYEVLLIQRTNSKIGALVEA